MKGGQHKNYIITQVISCQDQSEININETSLQYCLDPMSPAPNQQGKATFVGGFPSYGGETSVKQQPKGVSQIVMTQSFMVQNGQTQQYQQLNIQERIKNKLKDSGRVWQMCQSQVMSQTREPEARPNKVTKSIHLIGQLKTLKQTFISELKHIFLQMDRFLQSTKIELDRKYFIRVNYELESRNTTILNQKQKLDVYLQENQDLKQHNQRLQIHSQQIKTQFHNRISKMSIDLGIAERELFQLRAKSQQLQSLLINNQGQFIEASKQKQKLMQNNRELIRAIQELKHNIRFGDQRAKPHYIRSYLQGQFNKQPSSPPLKDLQNGSLGHLISCYNNFGSAGSPHNNLSLKLLSTQSKLPPRQQDNRNKEAWETSCQRLSRDNESTQTKLRTQECLKTFLNKQITVKGSLSPRALKISELRYSKQKNQKKSSLTSSLGNVRLDKLLPKEYEADDSTSIPLSYRRTKKHIPQKSQEKKEIVMIQSAYHPKNWVKNRIIEPRLKIQSNDVRKHIEQSKQVEKQQIDQIKQKINRLKVQLQSEMIHEKR